MVCYTRILMRIDLGDEKADPQALVAQAKVADSKKKQQGPPPSKFKKWLMRVFPSFFKNTRVS